MVNNTIQNYMKNQNEDYVTILKKTFFFVFFKHLVMITICHRTFFFSLSSWPTCNIENLHSTESTFCCKLCKYISFMSESTYYQSIRLKAKNNICVLKFDYLRYFNCNNSHEHFKIITFYILIISIQIEKS